MLGPYDRLDLWLDRRLPELSATAKPSPSRNVVRLVFSLSQIVVATVLILASALGPWKAVHPEVRLLALLGWAVAVFVLGYVVHMSKRWLRAARRGERTADE